jgi:GGDEF domain-containing protein
MEMPISVFDKIDPGSLERRQWHLWLLAMAVMVIFAVGLALLMYPTVFEHPVVLTGPTQRKAFFGFCGLSILVLGYLVDRQFVISDLRKSLAEEQKMIIRVRHEASSDLLETLPGYENFQDSLAMEYRRAVATHHSLSLALVVLKSTRKLADTIEVGTAFGDAAKAMIRKLRGEDSIYHFAPGVFCILFPGVGAADAYEISERLTGGLQDASGASTRFSFDIRIVNYPEHAATAREIQDAVRAVIPEGALGPLRTELGTTTQAQ